MPPEVERPMILESILKAVLRNGQTPLQRHFWWQHIMSLSQDSPGVDEHQFLCETLEATLTYDQCNATEHVAFEGVARRLQLWEEFYAHRLRDASSGQDSAV